MYGRLLDPDCTLGTDPRSDPRMVKAFAAFGLDGRLPAAPLSVDSPLEDRIAFATMSEEGMGAILDALGGQLPVVEGVTTTTTTIAGPDGNDIPLFVSTPDERQGPLPAVVHLHGGGMAIGSAADTGYMRIRESLAATGLVVIGVEFRNSGGRLGPHPFPAGLNDCAAAVRWVAANRAALGVEHLVVSGESGGGNLTLTVTHKAKREGWLHEIAGLYAQCPYISNRWLDQCDDLPSLEENDEYFVSRHQLALLGSIYNPDGSHADDPTCWAAVATDGDLEGLPPHVISVNELDPLRDEGLAYYRRLVRAGVPAVGRVVAGTCHGGDLLLGAHLPEVYAASIRDVSGFAKSLG
ncbi:alpha/beta hydrolase fold domain-containing protein [Mycolicibacterium flavescens]|uniref:Alpha/beta hydrolase n=1 Tax=Mycolicibacterium flavescens TaxID=1776 RepID=A0A1E3RD78_MYCFV|nr:alpha/beta hydrolase fold domain-containing protein [Mycolicibacterium flavescens]MCV7278406.1 alpha/beta hydrolase fold domain-containing protein [Mycolicibacterium flavescens]ODQ87804.1 alpha/beta hydrolase [Mycolicibacterium flavescens]